MNEASAKCAAHLSTPGSFGVAKFQTATIERHGVKETCPVTFEVVSETPLKIKGEATLGRAAFGIGEPYDAPDKYAPSIDVAMTVSAKLQD